MADQSENIFIGNIIDCIKNTGTNDKRFQLRTIKNGKIAVKGSKIVGICEDDTPLETFQSNMNFTDPIVTQLTKSQILIPGLIDTHIHAPQYPNCGLGYDKPLLEWLETYTYPIEKQYRDLDFSKQVYDLVVRKTLDHGTTTASYFGSMILESDMVLVDSILGQGQRALVGKINMQRFCPEDYCETHEESIENTNKFIEYIAEKETTLVMPTITPRFAPSCEQSLLSELGSLAKEHNLNIQSHISENKNEIKLVKSLFDKKYAEVYDSTGLLTSKTIMAHGVHLEKDEIELFVKNGAGVAHCPTSNTSLQSGLCDVRKLLQAGVNVGLGTDISGGESPSIVTTMRAALETSIHVSYTKKEVDENYKPLNYGDVFYLATLGGAQALALDDLIGNFEENKEFDALIVDLDVQNSSCDLIGNREYDILELLQKFVYVSDDRNVFSVYVAGTMVK